MATLSIRLDAQTASKIDRIIARTGKKKSEIVREAISGYAHEIDKTTKNERPYDMMAPDLGSFDSGGMQLSTRTGRDFTEMLKREKDARSTRRHRPSRGAHR
jgi:hypothetical protein